MPLVYHHYLTHVLFLLNRNLEQIRTNLGADLGGRLPALLNTWTFSSLLVAPLLALPQLTAFWSPFLPL